MRILVIGGEGYVGSELVSYLSNSFDITSVDIRWFGQTRVADEVQYYQGDYATLTKEFLAPFRTIVLLAGHSSVKMCEDNLEGCFNNNVRNFIQLLPKLKPSQKFIYASSSSVYGNINTLGADENCRTYIPNNYYDLSKSEIDNYAQLYPDLNYYGLRFGTVNGNSKNLRNELMLNSMSLSAQVNKEIHVYNAEIHRPILGIQDLVKAIEKIIVSTDAPGIYNLASFNLAVDQIASRISKFFNVPVVNHHTPPVQIENAKSQTKAYDFTISSEKFKETYNFQFNETVESICQSLVNRHESLAPSDSRSRKIEYL